MTSEPHYSDWKFLPTDNVVLQAVAKPGYVFVNWTGDVNGAMDTSQSTITVQTATYYPDKQNLQIAANFTAPEGLYTVAVEGKPSEGGSVTIQTPCGSFTTDNVQPAISIQLAAGTEVTLTAAPVEGYGFRRWKGDLSGREDNVTVNVDSDKAIVASFAKPSPFPWVWVAAGAAAFLAVVLVSMGFVFSRRRKAEGIQPGAESPS